MSALEPNAPADPKTAAAPPAAAAVHWTGFGPFHGVADNPSRRLAEAVASKNPGDSWAALEVSAAAAKAYRAPACDLVVHLGVAKTYSVVTLERCAFNEATFKDADQRGFRPQAERIDEQELGRRAENRKIDVEAAAAAARRAGHSVDVSDDAGRFVCNYIYWCGLREARPCVFVHVPPFAAVGEREQLATLEALRGCLLAARTDPARWAPREDLPPPTRCLKSQLLELGLPAQQVRVLGPNPPRRGANHRRPTLPCPRAARPSRRPWSCAVPA